MRKRTKKLIVLAGMIALDEDALICDLAETYGIFRYEEYPVTLIAKLSAGLRDDSRIKRKIIGVDMVLNEVLLASIADSLRILVWMRTKDGMKGKNVPDPIMDRLMGVKKSKENKDIMVFESGIEFEAKRQALVGET